MVVGDAESVLATGGSGTSVNAASGDTVLG